MFICCRDNDEASSVTAVVTTHVDLIVRLQLFAIHSSTRMFVCLFVCWD